MADSVSIEQLLDILFCKLFVDVSKSWPKSCFWDMPLSEFVKVQKIVFKLIVRTHTEIGKGRTETKEIVQKRKDKQLRQWRHVVVNIMYRKSAKCWKFYVLRKDYITNTLVLESTKWANIRLKKQKYDLIYHILHNLSKYNPDFT